MPLHHLSRRSAERYFALSLVPPSVFVLSASAIRSGANVASHTEVIRTGEEPDSRKPSDATHSARPRPTCSASSIHGSGIDADAEGARLKRERGPKSSLSGSWTGYTQDGEQMVRHVRQQYGTNVVDLVVSSHYDDDSSKGLRSVLEQMDVRLLGCTSREPRTRSAHGHERSAHHERLSDKFTRSLASAHP